MQLQLEAVISNCSREEASGELSYPISSLYKYVQRPYRTYDLSGREASKDEDQPALDPASKHLSRGRSLPFSLFPSSLTRQGTRMFGRVVASRRFPVRWSWYGDGKLRQNRVAHTKQLAGGYLLWRRRAL